MDKLTGFVNKVKESGFKDYDILTLLKHIVENPSTLENIKKISESKYTIDSPTEFYDDIILTYLDALSMFIQTEAGYYKISYNKDLVNVSFEKNKTTNIYEVTSNDGISASGVSLNDYDIISMMATDGEFVEIGDVTILDIRNLMKNLLGDYPTFTKDDVKRYFTGLTTPSPNYDAGPMPLPTSKPSANSSSLGSSNHKPEPANPNSFQLVHK